MTRRLRLPPRPRLRRWRHWPLRHRMVVTVAALAAVALIVADFAGSALLRSYLIGRLDAQLDGQARAVSRAVRYSNQLPRALRPGPPFGGDSRTYAYSAAGVRIYTAPTSGTGEPDLGGFGSVRKHAGTRAYTVPGDDADWRVRVTLIATPDGNQQYVVHALSMREVNATEDGLVLIDVAVTALVLLFIALAAASVVR